MTYCMFAVELGLAMKIFAIVQGIHISVQDHMKNAVREFLRGGL